MVSNTPNTRQGEGGAELESMPLKKFHSKFQEMIKMQWPLPFSAVEGLH
jgi:hypothetical protein